jgi:hypothetical protein
MPEAQRLQSLLEGGRELIDVRRAIALLDESLSEVKLIHNPLPYVIASRESGRPIPLSFAWAASSPRFVFNRAHLQRRVGIGKIHAPEIRINRNVFSDRDEAHAIAVAVTGRSSNLHALDYNMG